MFTGSIIFEGPDMCGKTNIARALSRRLGIPYFKNSGERGAFGMNDGRYFADASRYIDTYMTKFLSDTGTRVIFDRNYPSQYVYPRVFKREQDMHVLARIDEAHASIGTAIIIPLRSSYTGITDDVHDFVDASKLEALDACYRDFRRWSKCETLLLNVDDEDLERELHDITTWLGELGMRS